MSRLTGFSPASADAEWWQQVAGGRGTAERAEEGGRRGGATAEWSGVDVCWLDLMKR